MLRLAILIVASLASTIAMAQEVVPDARTVISNDVDYPGGDLASIFDTTLGACESACIADTRCTAFTYNTVSNACFPKAAVDAVVPFAGAISGRIVRTDPAIANTAAARAADLSFLPPGLLEDALNQARRIGGDYPVDGRDIGRLADLAEQARRDGATLTALRAAGALVAASDRSDAWKGYATIARTLTGTDGDAVAEARRRAVPAAINAYLRAPDTVARVAALSELARALEADGHVRATIPALRLAADIAPNAEVDDALDRVVGLYGFAIAETQVESDSASPRICAQFNETLVQAGVDYDTYVQTPDPRLVVSVNDAQLCIDGVEHGARYTVIFREGLPSATGETLQRDVPLTLYVRDRSPAVRFVGRAYVLPRTGDPAIPVETVNLEALDLTLSRVGDRAIVQTLRDDLFASPLYAWERDYFEDRVGEVIWTGTAEVAGELNQDRLTRLPLSEALAGAEPGLYVLDAAIPDADPYEEAPATQWFVLSDIGIATFQGTDGLTVVTRGLGDALPRGGVEVTLLSRANAVLGTQTTDAGGIATFPAGLTRGTGSSAPSLVTVTDGRGDLAFLSLGDPAFDLSDRGVEGREPAPPIDVFLATDRGAYRAGEVIHLTALMRDARAEAVDAIPLTALLIRPDGVEYSRVTGTDPAAGGHVFDLPVAGTAPRGAWRIEVRADLDAPPLASTTVLVEDFLPERIDVDLETEALLTLGVASALGVEARYLFGPAAPDLAVEGDVLLRAAGGLPDWPGYVFGRYDTPFAAEYAPLGDGSATGTDGTATLDLSLPAPAAIPARPLEAVVSLRVSEGSGRPVERTTTVPVLPGVPMIGIAPRLDGVVGEGEEAAFSLIALGPDLDPREMDVTWTINRLETRYQWYQLDGNWSWDPVTTRTRIATGDATLGGDPVAVSAQVDWGRYEIVVERTGGDYVSSATDFYAGWYAPADASATPDFLEASLDAESYAPGDVARFRIVPRAAGQALITVMSDRVISMEVVAVPQGGSVIELPVTDDWGAGAYVTASVVQPMDVAEGRNPARALGLDYAPVAPGDHALSVTLDVPEQVRPREPLNVAIAVDGVLPDETAYVTLAAVDVGILNLTGFEAPDPQAYYFGQRKLGVELRDVYGRLIDGLTGDMGVVRSGGDAGTSLTQQAPRPTEELVAFFTGPVTVGPNGRAEASFDLPGFNGTVRLMAVAWSDTGVGQASADVVVRDPVVVTASVPRFMAPGDESRLLIEVTHADGPAGEVELRFASDGIVFDAVLDPVVLTLDEGGTQTYRLPIRAGEPGTGALTVTLTTPSGEELVKPLMIPVEINDPEIARSSRFTLAAGETFTFDDAVFTGLLPGSGSATLSIGPLARLDAPGLLNALDRYPYGCTEQVVSRALPLLYVADVAAAMGVDGGDDPQGRIEDAVRDVLGNQASNGAFGLWGAYSGDLWLDAYVTDFLSRARVTGVDVPEVAFVSAMDNLRNAVAYAPDFEDGGDDVAYALMVLAREGAAAVGDLRYYADEKGADFTTPIAAAQLGAALAFYGDQPRADAMFARASAMVAASVPDRHASLWRADYGTAERDAAAVLALAVDAGSTAVDRDMLTDRLVDPGARVSTQEAAWTLLAADALTRDIRQTGITIDGAVPKGPLVRLRAAASRAAPVAVANGGTEATEITVTSFGVPAVPLPAGGNGYAIDRAYYTLEGAPATLDAVSSGTRLVAVLTVTPFGRQEARLMVDDPLPAGFEIDNPNLLRGGDVGALDWLDPVRAQNAEFREDRFLAAVDWRSDAPFTLAYIVRAVSPGAFHHPAASVEDMYRPQMRARTGAGRLTVTE